MRGLNVVIMCGGNGSRLWPLSTRGKPKQLLRLMNDLTMFQLTVVRQLKLDPDRIIIISSSEHLQVIKNQLLELDLVGTQIELIGEPCRRDTAAAVCVGTLSSFAPKQSNDIEPIVLVVPADHIFDDVEYVRCVNEGIEHIDDHIVTIGIKPLYPETGYGYIKVRSNGELEKFIEKPNVEKAIEYVENGNYYWNAGVFLFRKDMMINMFKRHAKDILDDCRATMQQTECSDNEVLIPKDLFSKIRPISVDYAVMEKIDNGYTVIYNSSWKDIGTWGSLYDSLHKDSEDNVVNGQAVLIDSRNCLVKNTTDRPIGLIGMQDTIVVATDDGFLVSQKEYDQKVKQLEKEVRDLY